jgi:hypothetical protein
MVAPFILISALVIYSVWGIDKGVHFLGHEIKRAGHALAKPFRHAKPAPKP